MNIFYLDEEPRIAAQYACDQHVVKMIVETAQLLSTAHRILDGKEYIDSSSGRKIRRWALDDYLLDKLFYHATHINHPSAIWVRSNRAAYDWTVRYLYCLCDEYTLRYGKTHKTESLAKAFNLNYPKNLDPSNIFSPPPQTMPEQYKLQDTVEAYRRFYIYDKSKFAKWKHGNIPDWFRSGSRISEESNYDSVAAF